MDETDTSPWFKHCLGIVASISYGVPPVLLVRNRTHDESSNPQESDGTNKNRRFGEGEQRNLACVGHELSLSLLILYAWCGSKPPGVEVRRSQIDRIELG